MEPQVRFCNAADGTRIGYAVLGEGPPLVLVYSWGNTIETEWRNAGVRTAYEQLSEGRQLVIMSRRGFGASQRDVDDLSLDAQTSDLEAVVNASELDRFDLWGFGDSNGACVAYSVRTPAKVSRLILWDAYVRGSDFMPEGAIRSLVELARENWGMA
ncbi:MAG: transcriptional regulator, partial [Dehalococcoidia bacterium]